MNNELQKLNETIYNVTGKQMAECKTNVESLYSNLNQELNNTNEDLNSLSAFVAEQVRNLCNQLFFIAI